MHLTNRCAAALAVAVLVVVPSAALGNGAPIRPLITAAARTAAGSDRAPGRDVIRSREVIVDPTVLPDALTGAPGSARIAIDLFDDLRLTFVVDSIERMVNGATVWSGHAEGVAGSIIRLARVGTAVQGRIVWPGGRNFEIRYAGRVHRISEVVPRRGGPEDAVRPPIAGNVIRAQGVRPASTSAPAIADLLAAYTANSRAAAGGTDAMNALIALSVSDANGAYLDSEVNLRVRLVHTMEVQYDDSSTTMDTSLDDLRNPSDGKMDEVHAARDQYGADLVTLWREPDASYCGLGYLLTTLSSSDFAPWAFSNVGRGCESELTLAHEMGHNMGCAHDRQAQVGLGTPIEPYAYGYLDPQGLFRTVMAYADYCNGDCPVIPYFSNPNVLYNGRPTGVGGTGSDAANNAAMINLSAPTIAALRSTVVQDAVPVTNVTPQSGSTQGGTTITITGANFAAGATVTVGGAAASNVVVGSATSITATTPPHHSGAADVVVTNAGGASGSEPAAFRYVCTVLPSAQITAPATFCVGPSAGTASVPDAGSGATYAWQVDNGGEIVTASNGRSVGFYPIAGYASLLLTATVTSADGCSATASRQIAIEMPPSPTITAPSAVVASTGGYTATVDVTGTYQWTITNGTITAGTNAKTVTFTAGSSGSVQLGVTVTSAGGCSGSNSLGVSIVSQTALYVASVTPASGPLAGGTAVTISGRNFQSGATVSFGSAAATVSSVTSTAINATAPPSSASGPVGVTVRNPSGETFTLTEGFRYGAPGDANGDGSVNAADVFCLVNSLFGGGAAPAGSADENGDGKVTAADVFYLINYLYTGGPSPH